MHAAFVRLAARRLISDRVCKILQKQEKAENAQLILDTASDENMAKMGDIYAMLDNTLAENEDLSVAGATFQ